MAVNIDYFKGVADRTVFYPTGDMAQFPGGGVSVFDRIIYPAACRVGKLEYAADIFLKELLIIHF